MNSPADKTPAGTQLAIVIPAFRRKYLAEALASFAAQTDQRFHLYIADDGSPERLGEVVESFRGRLDLTYHRFEDNLGIDGLVRHWHRSIALSQEPWIWLFSDDDLAAPDSVATVRREIDRAPGAKELLRFDVDFVDARAGLLRQEIAFPPRLSAGEYAYHLLSHPDRPCMIQNVVFPRSVYQAEGGFSPTIGGYSSDSATWPRFARAGGIRRLPGGKVRFRYHEASVGAQIGYDGARRMEAIDAYRVAILGMRSVGWPGQAAGGAWRRAELGWFGHWFRFLPSPLLAAEKSLVDEVMAELWPGHAGQRWVYFWRNYARVPLRRMVHHSRLLSALHRRLVQSS